MSIITRSSWIILTGAALMLANCVEPEVTGVGAPAGQQVEQPPVEEGTMTRTTKLVEDTDYTRGLELYDNVKVLSATQAIGMEKSDTQLILADMTQEGGFVAGDVVVSDVGDGVFRVVESASELNGRLVLTTRPAKLEDAIANGEIYMAKLAEDNITPPESFLEGVSTNNDGLITHTQGLGFEKDVGWKGTLYEYNEDFKDRLNNVITDEHFTVLLANVNAEIGAEVYANVKTKLAFPPKIEIDGARIATNGKVVGNFRIRMESDEAFTYNDTITLVGPASAEPLTRFEPKSHTLLPGIFPLKFTFSVNSELTVNASADGEVEADMGYQIIAGAMAGVEKKDGDWRFIQRNDLVPQQYGPVFRGEKNAQADANITTTLSLTIGEKANGYANLKPAEATGRFSQQINADTGECPTELDLHVKGTFEGQLKSIDIPILGTKEIMGEAVSSTLYDRQLISYSEQLDLPGICDPGYTPPTHAGDKLPSEKCGGDEECVNTADCFKNTCVTRGEFRVSAAWYENTDADIFVTTPDENTLSYSYPNGDGGQQDFSTCYRECSNSAPHVESIYFENGAGRGTYKDGTYRVWLKHDGREGGGKFDIEVKMGDEHLEFSGDLPAGGGETEVFEFVLEGGQIVGGMSTGGNGQPAG